MHTRTVLTIGVLGTAGAVGTYLYSRPKLRKQMMESASAHEAVNVFTAQVEKDAVGIAKSVKRAAVRNWLTSELRLTGHRLGKRFLQASKHAKRDVKSMKHETQAMKDEAMHLAHRIRHKAKGAVKLIKQAVQTSAPNVT